MPCQKLVISRQSLDWFPNQKISHTMKYAPLDSPPEDSPAVPLGKRTRWHYIYFLLAGINILAITASISFSRAITNDFSHSVHVNREWV